MDESSKFDSDVLSGVSGTTRVESLALEAEGSQEKRDKTWIKALSWEESRCVIRNCLIAATAKNCSLMVTLRPLCNKQGTSFPQPSASITTCPTTGVKYIYKVRQL